MNRQARVAGGGGWATGCGGALTRREFIRLGSAGVVGLGLAEALAFDAWGQTGPQAKAKAKAVIQLWMGGGPSHLDTFDPKPNAGEDYCGPYKKPIDTNVPGIRIAQTLPKLARCADKYSIIRGLTHGVNGHETATYIVQTGTLPSGDLVYPSIGAVVAFKKEESGYPGPLPPYVTITTPLGRFSEAGFLGPRYRPFATGGDPGATPFTVEGLASPGISDQRMQDRRGLLRSLDTLSRQVEAPSGPASALTEMQRDQQKAYDLLTGDAKKAFDLSQEADDLRGRYGRHWFGQSCLLARRLVASGVPFVTVNWGGWDTHKQNFERMDVMLPQLDQGFSALLEDLAGLGLLDTTIVVWYGEFGRTPKIEWNSPWNGGRGHFGDAFSCVVAGGGFQGGKVVGATDWRGERVVTRPVYPWDLSASIYQLLGIDPHGTLPHPRGCVAYVTPIAGGNVQSGGLLKEIM